MGNFIGSPSAFIGSIFCPIRPESALVLVGLDNAGKTTLLNTFEYKHSISFKTKPTVGNAVKRVEYKNISLIIWDLGGQTATRKLWHHYFEDLGGLDSMIYMIDICDEDRYQQAVEVFYDVVADVLKQENSANKPMPAIFVCFNKIDLYREVKQSVIQGLQQQHKSTTTTTTTTNNPTNQQTTTINNNYGSTSTSTSTTTTKMGGMITIPSLKEGGLGKTLQQGTDTIIELKRNSTEPLTLPTTALEDLIVKNKTNDLINLFKSNERFPLIRNRFVKFVPISALTGEGCDYLLDIVYHKSLKL